jgi:hypothetical protein
VIDYYAGKACLKRVPGEGGVDEINARLLAALQG